MRIATKKKLPITHDGKVTEIKPLKLDPANPGFSLQVNYKEINHNDPVVADQLFIFRKHGFIKFDEILYQDKKIVKEILDDKNVKPEDTDAAIKKAIAEKQGLKPSPNKPKPQVAKKKVNKPVINHSASESMNEMFKERKDAERPKKTKK